MKEQTRNLLVGLTVLIALVLLGAMIIIFQDLPGFLQVGYPVRMHFPDSGRMDVGADVFLAGQRVGRVTNIELTRGDSRQGVDVTAIIDREINVPGNVNAYISGRGLGGIVVDLRSDDLPPGSQRKDPATGGPLDWLPRRGGPTVEGRMDPGGGLIPAKLRQDLGDAAASIKRLADKLDGFFTPPATTGPAATGSAPATAPAPPPTLFATLAKLNKALDAVNKTLGDSENQANLKASLANLKSGLASFRAAADAGAKAMADARDMLASAKLTFNEVSDATRNASKRFGELTERLIDDADRIGQVLTSIHRSTVKIEKGQGTAGKLIHDDQLYNKLVDATDALSATLEELSALLAEWKEKGVKMKLK